VRCELVMHCSSLSGAGLVCAFCGCAGDSLPTWVEQGNTDADNAAWWKRSTDYHLRVQGRQTAAYWVAKKATTSGHRYHLRQVLRTFVCGLLATKLVLDI